MWKQLTMRGLRRCGNRRAGSLGSRRGYQGTCRDAGTLPHTGGVLRGSRLGLWRLLGGIHELEWWFRIARRRIRVPKMRLRTACRYLRALDARRTLHRTTMTKLRFGARLPRLMTRGSSPSRLSTQHLVLGFFFGRGRIIRFRCVGNNHA